MQFRDPLSYKGEILWPQLESKSSRLLNMVWLQVISLLSSRGRVVVPLAVGRPPPRPRRLTKSHCLLFTPSRIAMTTKDYLPGTQRLRQHKATSLTPSRHHTLGSFASSRLDDG